MSDISLRERHAAVGADLELDLELSRPDEGVRSVVGGLRGTVVVLGASGKMGLHLCLMLQRAAQETAQSLRLVAVARFQGLRSTADFERAGIETWRADLSDESAVVALPDAETVFFLAGVKFGTAKDPGLLHRMNVVMPRLVARRYAGARIVAFSTGCVYPKMSPATGGADESVTPAAEGAYAASCIERERAFMAEAESSGTRVALIRLNYAVECRYGVLVDIARKIGADEPVDLACGEVNLIWQRDALLHVVQALEVAASPAVPVNVTGAEVLSVRALAEALGAAMGRVPRFRGEPEPVAWLNQAAWSHRRWGQPPTSVVVMVEKVASWWRQERGTWGKPTGFEVRDGKF